MIRRPQLDRSGGGGNDRSFDILNINFEVASRPSRTGTCHDRASYWEYRSRRMVTRDCTAACSGRCGVSDNRAAQASVIRHSDVRWTGKAANRLEFKGTDVSAVAGRGVYDGQVVERARQSALVK